MELTFLNTKHQYWNTWTQWRGPKFFIITKCSRITPFVKFFTLKIPQNTELFLHMREAVPIQTKVTTTVTQPHIFTARTHLSPVLSFCTFIFCCVCVCGKVLTEQLFLFLSTTKANKIKKTETKTFLFSNPAERLVESLSNKF